MLEIHLSLWDSFFMEQKIFEKYFFHNFRFYANFGAYDDSSHTIRSRKIQIIDL